MFKKVYGFRNDWQIFVVARISRLNTFEMHNVLNRANII